MDSKKYILKYEIWKDGDIASKDHCADIHGKTVEELWKKLGEKLRMFAVEFNYELWCASIWCNGKQIKTIK